MKSTLALQSGAVLAVLGAGLFTLPAQATPAISPATSLATSLGTLYERSSTHAYETGCAASVAEVTDQRAVPTNGRAVTNTSAAVTTVSKAGGPASTVDLRSTVTARLLARGGQFSTFDLAGTGRAAITVPAGQMCTASGRAQHELSVEVTFDRAQWLTVTTTSGSRSGSWVQVSRYGDTPLDYSMESEDAGGRSSATWYLAAGTYQVNAALNWYHFAAPGGPSGNHAGTGSIHLEAHGVGSAVAATTGTGNQYVGLADRVACADRTVSARIRPRVKQATFWVDGRKVRVVRHPRAGSTIKLPTRPTTATRVRVQLTVDPPGRSSHRVVGVSRAYRACAPTR